MSRHRVKRDDISWETFIGQRKTPIIITLYDKSLNEYDLKDYIEHGLRIIRFRITNFIMDDKMKLLEALKIAAASCCDKYNVICWPIAVAVDIPNASTITGFLSEELPSAIDIKKDSIIEVSSDIKFYSKCNANTIYINDPYTLPTVRPGTEISLGFGKIILHCLELVDNKTLKCKVTKAGVFQDQEIVCFRGVRILKPPLLKRDLDEITFAKKCKADVLIIHAVRKPGIILKIQALFKNTNKVPFILSGLCEEEGLSNADEIIAISDGVLLCREYLSVTLSDVSRLLRIQLQIGCKCKKLGKPFYISGNVLEQSLPVGQITGSDMNDVFAAQDQGAGFLLRNYPDCHNIITILRLVNELCMEPDLTTPPIFKKCWNLRNEIPVNAADACIAAAIMTAKLVDAKAIIVSTVTGKTAKELSHYCEDIYVVAVTTNHDVARRLQLYKGLICIIYENSEQTQPTKSISQTKGGKTPMRSKTESDPRIVYATSYATRFEVLKYANRFLVLRKGSSSSSYCDEISIWAVKEIEKTTLHVREEEEVIWLPWYEEPGIILQNDLS